MQALLLIWLMWNEYFQRNYEYGCACFSCLSKWPTGDIVNEQFLLAYKTQNFLTAIFINWESGFTVCMNFIWIVSRAPENQTRLFLLLASEFFGQNIDIWPTWSSVVTMATIHLPIQIWLFLFIPQGNLPPHKNWRGVKNFHFQLCFTFLENCS